jgi:uncharacterized protein YfdQ (DUF2303 family)
MDDDVLGAPKAWQIKDFPEGLRNRIIAAAKQDGQSVADYVQGVMVRHLDGEATAPEARANGFANRVNRPDPAIADLAALLTAVGTLPEHIPLPGEVRTLINDRARQARGAAPSKRQAAIGTDANG